MKKITVIAALGMALAFLPVAQPAFSPEPAHAAQMRSADVSAVDYMLDFFIVRPFHYIVLAGALITYPFAWLLDPLFADNPAKLKKTWIDTPYANAVERPLGNFNWKAR
jgi:hypothetical protein